MTRELGPSVCHIARDIALSGGGEVVKQVAKNSAWRGVEVVLITDTRGVDLGPEVAVRTTPFGGALLEWSPKSRMGWLLRHAAMILVFSLTSSFIALYYRARGWVVFNHNCESLVGQILVMHNVFTAELIDRDLGPRRTTLAMLNPVRLMRISKELILSRQLFKRQLISVSAAAEREVIWLAGNSERVTVIPNGVDVSRFSLVDALSVPPEIEEWKASSNIDHIVLFVGHEWKRKGLDELIEAMAVLPDKFGLVVVGGKTQDLPSYLERVASMGLRGRVLFAGEQSNIDSYYSAADVFCLPSNYETMPLVALEALAAGRPVVLTSECPAIDYIVQGMNGEITSHEPVDIAGCIQRVLPFGSDPERRRTIRQSVQNLGWLRVADAYLSAAADVADQDSSARTRRNE